MQHVQYDAVKRSACISKLASRDMRTKHDTQHSDAHLAIKVDYSEDMRRLKLKSKIEVLLVRLRERVGQSFMNPCRIILCYPTQRNNFMHGYVWNFLPGQRAGRSRGCGG